MSRFFLSKIRAVEGLSGRRVIYGNCRQTPPDIGSYRQTPNPKMSHISFLLVYKIVYRGEGRGLRLPLQLFLLNGHTAKRLLQIFRLICNLILFYIFRIRTNLVPPPIFLKTRLYADPPAVEQNPQPTPRPPLPPALQKAPPGLTHYQDGRQERHRPKNVPSPPFPQQRWRPRRSLTAELTILSLVLALG